MSIAYDSKIVVSRYETPSWEAGLLHILKQVACTGYTPKRK